LSRDKKVTNALATLINRKKGNIYNEKMIFFKTNSSSIGKEMTVRETRDCFYCKKKGHLKKFCNKWIRDGRPV